MSDTDHLVIGAGLSGLLAARRALDRGDRVLVVERQPRPGGLVHSVDIDGTMLDGGAEAFSTAEDACLRLAGELGLAGEIVVPDGVGAHIVSSERGRHLIPPGILGIPRSLDAAEVVAALTPGGLARARTLDSALLEPVDRDGEGGSSLADLVERRLGREVLETLVEPVVRGVYASSARQLPVETVPGLSATLRATGSLCAAVARIRGDRARPGSAVASLRGGLGRLIAALVDDLTRRGASFVFGAEVEALDRVGRGWVCRGAGSQWTARTLAVAAGGAGSVRLLSSGGDQSEPGRDVAADAVVALLAVESAQLDRFPLGTGALVADDVDACAQAVTHVTAKWSWVRERLAPHRHIIRLSYSRGDVATSTDLAAIAARDIESLFGVTDVRVTSTCVIRHRGALMRAGAGPARIAEETRAAAAGYGIELCSPLAAGSGLLGIVRDHYERTSA